MMVWRVMGTGSIARTRKSVYIETSVVSYLTSRRPADRATWQAVTVDWWETRRGDFDLYTSDVTVIEARRGNPEAAQRRLDALDEIPVLSVTTQVNELSEALLRARAIPRAYVGDSLHVAVSAVHGVDYLLTWNFRHLNNDETKPIMREVCELSGYSCPKICTPRQLTGVSNDV